MMLNKNVEISPFITASIHKRKNKTKKQINVFTDFFFFFFTLKTKSLTVEME